MRGKLARNLPEFLHSVFFYITTKPDLTFLKQKIRASCMPFRLAQTMTHSLKP